jgi:DNA invertase Pin-like site-specific DNA recombinase
MRAIIYRRVSKDEQKQGFSLESQQEDCLRNAEKNGYGVVADFEGFTLGTTWTNATRCGKSDS